jgi:hypothetical protein
VLSQKYACFSQHISLAHYKKTNYRSCFDWIIEKKKSGYKAYAIRALYELAKKEIGFPE